jgi:hypothetical protein
LSLLRDEQSLHASIFRRIEPLDEPAALEAGKNDTSGCTFTPYYARNIALTDSWVVCYGSKSVELLRRQSNVLHLFHENCTGNMVSDSQLESRSLIQMAGTHKRQRLHARRAA